MNVAPARERGLKYPLFSYSVGSLSVAPARERGLKSVNNGRTAIRKRRSREGAWIEIADAVYTFAPALCRSREGAWIEIV